mgnify:CR=1 FL=1
MSSKTLEIPVKGMDCADCTRHVASALSALPGVHKVDVFLASEKAILELDPEHVTLPMIRQAVAAAGYSVPEPASQAKDPLTAQAVTFSRKVLGLFGLVFGAVLLFVVLGEWLGVFKKMTAYIPWHLGTVAVLLAGFPVFINVVRAALRRTIIAHTLMTLGVLAALAVGEWTTAAVVVFFMRVGDYVEKFTSERARRAVKNLAALAPQTARLETEEGEIEAPISQVKPGDTVVIRPGEKIPVDGEVLSGLATIDQAAITGESMPVDAGPGSRVFAATLVRLGSLRVRVNHVGEDTTFGKVIRLVEQAEARRAEVQRLADRFSSWYLPIVSVIALLTFLLRRDPLAVTAVLVVACSCSFALATPIAIMASVGASARRGLLIKGGKYLEALARADVLLVDKTGTLTLGKPHICEIFPAAGLDEEYLLRMAASAERYSEHPLAEAVRKLAEKRGTSPITPQDFTALPGLGVKARLEGKEVWVGNYQFISESLRVSQLGSAGNEPDTALFARVRELEAHGKTILYVSIAGQLAGILAAEDALRPEMPLALEETKRLGIEKIELLTGDEERTAAELANLLNISYRASLLPEEKIAIVQQYQSAGRIVVMIGDGVNDAPALAQADVGIAMGAAGSDIAIEAAHIALMRDDWRLIPEALRIARRTMNVIKVNLAFTAVYNLVGVSLAALGILPPIAAAAAQSLPDLGILGNSSRLLKQ